MGALAAVLGKGIGAVNGVFGDFLAQSGNGLAITLGFRTADGTAVATDRAALARHFGAAGGDVAIYLHGLCCDEQVWQLYRTPGVPTMPEALQQTQGWTPVYVRYNSGRHIADNGEDLADALDRLVANWPVPVRRIALIGHSMGGLVARSAAHHALEANRVWPDRVTHLVCLGSPHHGAPLEKFGHVATTLLGALDITRPVAVAINARSVGIKDLRHGALRRDDWQSRHPDEHADDTRQPVRVLPKARHHYVGALLGATAESLPSWLIGDGLVRAPSATGHHADDRRRVPFAPGDGVMLPGLHHLKLVNHPAVAAHLLRWLA